jgi:hypothetical protein
VLSDEDRAGGLFPSTAQGAMLLGGIKRDSRPVDAIVEEALAHVKRCAAASKGLPSVH